MNIWRRGGITSLQATAVFKLQNFRFTQRKTHCLPNSSWKPRVIRKKGNPTKEVSRAFIRSAGDLCLVSFFFFFSYLPLPSECCYINYSGPLFHLLHLTTDTRSVHWTLGWPCCRIMSNLGACLNVVYYITSTSLVREDGQYPLADTDGEWHKTVCVYVTKLSLHFRVAYTYCVRTAIQLPGAEPHHITIGLPLVSPAWCHTTRCLGISEKSFNVSACTGI